MKKNSLFACILAFAAAVSCVVCDAAPATVVDASTEKKIDDIIGKMTIQEKVKLIAGNEMETYAIARVGIPQLRMCDGPLGVRHGQATAFPASVSLAASWSPETTYEVSSSLADEAKAKGRNMSLAPCINIHRVPMSGRNFESFGEDPYLASRMAVAYIKGVQDKRVVATVKHYACNNQEWERGTIDTIVDERALREIYLPAFEAAIKEGGSWSIMAAYNKVNGWYCTENDYLVNQILKKEWGFKGFMVSDWGATHSTVNCANYGLDLEMPKGDFFNDKLVTAVKKGEVKESVIDDKVRRILRAMYWLGLFDPNTPAGEGSLDTPAHRQTVREAGREGIVLLKNAGSILPIDTGKVKSIAVIGPNADVCRFGGGGSSEMSPFYSVSPLDGLKKKTEGKVTINYALGCKFDGEMTPIDPKYVYTMYEGKKQNGFLGEYFNNRDLNGTPALKRVDKQISFVWGGNGPESNIPSDGFSVRWTAKLVPPKTAEYEISLMSDDGSRLYLDGKEIIENWRDHGEETKTATVMFEAGREYDLRVEFYENGGMASVKIGWDTQEETTNAAIEAAKKSDIAIVFVGLSKRYEGEGWDRSSLVLPAGQDALISRVSDANKNTIVVLNTGAPVLIDKWIDKVHALVEAWYPGQEGGNSIADVLFGDYNPSGKLPMTFPVRWEDCSAYPTYPGKNGKTFYSDGIYVGYRHFDKENTKVMFPFGYGLSYTTFEYSNISVTPASVQGSDINVEVSFDLKNTGERAGAEVAQMYIRDTEASVDRPVRELKGFKRVYLEPGETKRIAFKLDKRSLSFYDVKNKQWTAEPGEFEVIIGSSSRDAKLKGILVLQEGKLI
ncbi:MAG: glycoside hydrolase family 3 C-terminal domain-containing protein [Candidatus Omnitrophica bacterium]|nr:glycoside hydrolase family 3 C-terminal domain-containing protein [Candidatus Omnitrophota bacterium]